ncbi:MAG: DUF975 family protein [Lachnospiraceae bacterium]|nr:DUF975 family protein [Lachnospiraceae bacterium]
MNWKISEVKGRGKATLKAGYWKCVLVAFIMTLVSGGISSCSGNMSSFSNMNNSTSGSIESDDSLTMDDIVSGNIDADDPEELNRVAEQLANELVDSPYLGTIIGVAIGVIVIALIISLAISYFLIMPLTVGSMKFYKEASEHREYDIGRLGYSFSGHYMNIVKITFLMSFKIFLWSLLFIIPGIIKSYEYRLIPLILTDDPTISSADAFRRTKEMMTGNKWHTFLLDLSFFGWILLAICTCGIVGIFYVFPYIYCTEAELYLTLRGLVYGQPAGDQHFADPVPVNTNTSYDNAPYVSSVENEMPASDTTGYGSDTPAFGDDRNRMGGGDKPFNTPY